jgi:hypothetical protein
MVLEGRALPSTFTVESTADGGSAGTLRWAIDQANAGGEADTIVFSNLFNTPQTITLTKGPLILTDTATTTITGPGANALTVNGGGSSGVFEIRGGSAALSGLTISGGTALVGGGLYNRGGTATLTNCYVTDNAATVDGGGLANATGGTLILNGCTVGMNSVPGGGGGGLWNAGNATLTDCGFALNQADSGGGLYNDSHGVLSLTSVNVSSNTAVEGAGLYNRIGKTTLTNCTVSNNQAGPVGGGLYNTNPGILSLTGCTVSDNSTVGYSVNIGGSGGGGLYSLGTTTLTDCTVSGNYGTENGGGLYVRIGTTTLTDCTVSDNLSSFRGGGLQSGAGSTLTLTGSTVSDNTTSGSNPLKPGGGGGGLFCQGTATLTDCTVSGNTTESGFGGGLYSRVQKTLTLTNCTVSGNYAPLGGGLYVYSRFGGTTTLSNTIVAGSANGGDILGPLDPASAHNLIGGNPLLAPLGDYGGSTLTMPLLPGSPAIGKGTTAGAPATDQRGLPRVGLVDIGAFQSQGFTLAPVAGSTPQSALAGAAFSQPLAVAVNAKNPVEPVDGGIVSFAAPAAGASASLSAATATVVNGQVSATATAGTIAGSYTVTASVAGVTTPASFALTNTAAALKLVAQPVAAVAGGAFINVVVATFTDSDPNAGPSDFVAAITWGDGITTSSTTVIADGQGRFDVLGTHTYVDTGTYTFNVQVTDNSGASATAASTATVTAHANTEAPSPVLTTHRDVVDTFDDLASLQAAIAYANSHPGPDTITYDPAAFGKARRTIKLIGGPLVLTDPATVTIIGPGANRLTLSGGGKSRVFDIEGGSLALEGLTITGGRADRGGGILNQDGTLALDRVVVRGNHARVGGGLFNDGKATLTHVVIRGNSTHVGSGLFSTRNATLTRGRSPAGGRG